MSNIFVSHSSHDTPFVTRLASALLSEGLPVWLDAWRMEVGDSLIDQVYGGIDSASVVIVVLSRYAVESGWVNRELNAALAKEQQVGRNVLIPIRLDTCDVPLQIADRLYADFSSSFSEPFAKLSSALQRLGAKDLSVEADRELLALVFTREVHLDSVSYGKNIRYIKRRQGALRLTSRQVVVADDYKYDILLKRLHARLDNLGSDPYYSPNFESQLRWSLDYVLENERKLCAGTALISIHCDGTNVEYWFARIVRAQTVYELWSCQMPGATDNLTYGKTWGSATLMTDSQAEIFFETSKVRGVEVWRKEDPTKPFSLWLGHEGLGRQGIPGLEDDQGHYTGPKRIYDAVKYSAIKKYVYPQLVLQHLSLGTPMIWDLSEAMVGIR